MKGFNLSHTAKIHWKSGIMSPIHSAHQSGMFLLDDSTLWSCNNAKKRKQKKEGNCHMSNNSGDTVPAHTPST